MSAWPWAQRSQSLLVLLLLQQQCVGLALFFHSYSPCKGTKSSDAHCTTPHRRVGHLVAGSHTPWSFPLESCNAGDWRNRDHTLHPPRASRFFSQHRVANTKTNSGVLRADGILANARCPPQIVLYNVIRPWQHHAAEAKVSSTCSWNRSLRRTVKERLAKKKKKNLTNFFLLVQSWASSITRY